MARSQPPVQGNSSANWEFNDHLGPLLGVTTFESAWKERLADCLPMLKTLMTPPPTGRVQRLCGLTVQLAVIVALLYRYQPCCSL